MKPCNGLRGEILESPVLNAFKSRKTAARKDKDIADDAMDNLLSSFQVICKHYSEEEEKTIFQVVPHSFPFPRVTFSFSYIKMLIIIPLLTYDCSVKPMS